MRDERPTGQEGIRCEIQKVREQFIRYIVMKNTAKDIHDKHIQQIRYDTLPF
jgi:hypothetical protein